MDDDVFDNFIRDRDRELSPQETCQASDLVPQVIQVEGVAVLEDNAYGGLGSASGAGSLISSSRSAGPQSAVLGTESPCKKQPGIELIGKASRTKQQGAIS